MVMAAKVMVGIVAFLHIYIMCFEMFAWESRGPKVFRSFPKELFSQTKALAANQGLYNGFLAAGLIWSLFITDMIWQKNVAAFFLICVAVAGLYGAATAEKKILFVQTVPALMALVFVFFV